MRTGRLSLTARRFLLVLAPAAWFACSTNESAPGSAAGSTAGAGGSLSAASAGAGGMSMGSGGGFQSAGGKLAVPRNAGGSSGSSAGVAGAGGSIRAAGDAGSGGAGAPVGSGGRAGRGGAPPTLDAGTDSSAPLGAGGASPGPQSDAGGLAKPSGSCPKLTFEANQSITSTSLGTRVDTDLIRWRDVNCLPRTAAMARDAAGYVRQFSYQYDGKTRTASGTNASSSWNGFGYIVNHELDQGGTSPAGGSTGYQALFVGDHHAIYQYQANVGGNVRVTRHWMFATGRDHPVFAVTFDTSARSPGVGADTRTPYGDIAWDGDENASTTVVDGVGWGDRYKFVTTKAPLSLNSTWDYSSPNSVPYCMQWRVSPDAEMGLVQSQTYPQHDAGGYWLYSNWGKTSANQTKSQDQIAVMPVDWNWPYQLNQYELCYPNSASCVNSTTSSHRLAWGANYGAVGGADGRATYPAFGDDKQIVGHPYQSYSVFVVLGKHSANTVLNQVREIEVVQQTTMTATVGAVVTEGAGGVGRTDTVKLDPPGYDARYSTWNIQAASNRAAFAVRVGADAIVNPVVVVHGFTGATVPAITVDGTAAVADVDFFASIDATGQALWITFRPGWRGTRQITIG